MSAIRGSNRRAGRNVQSSPYAAARPPKKKSVRYSRMSQSSWTFGISGILNYINPLRLRRSADHLTEEVSEQEQDTEDAESESSRSNDALMHSPNDYTPPVNIVTAQGGPAASLAARGRQLANGLNDPPSPNNLPRTETMFSTPPRAAPYSLDEDVNLSPAESLDKVQRFLREKSGQSLSEWETRGLLTFLEKSAQSTVDDDKPEPFRFSASPSRTPTRGNSPSTPLFVFGAPAPTSIPAPTGHSTAPRKTLAKNPNGVYRWQGGGSAKHTPSRNRYQSPAFGVRAPAPTIMLTPAKTEGKRRRVTEEPTAVPFPAVSPQKAAAESVPTPTPSQSRASIFPPANGSPGENGASSSKTNGASAPRLRTSGLPTKPTAPPIPSPLRQAWGQADSPPHSPKPPHAHAQTKAASFMAGLIKEVTPARKPDLSNPYQTASPVPTKRAGVKAKKPRAPKPAAVVETEVKIESVPEPDTRPEPSQQAIIEATMPKGSKRSRPPADLAKSSRLESSFAPSAPAPGLRGPRQTLNLPHVKNDAAMVIEEADDQEEQLSLAARKRRKTPVKETLTVEEIDDVDMPTSKSPSPGLFSQPTEIIEPESDNANSANPSTSSSSSALPTSPTKSASASLFGLKSSAPKEPSKLRFSYQADKPDSETPLPPLTFTPNPVAPAAPKSTGTFTFDPRQTVLVMSVHDLPTYTFPSPFSPMLPPVAARNMARSTFPASLPSYDFAAPLPAPAKEKPAAPPVMAFNWSGAGMKAPSASGASWTCSSCMLSNPASATDKCTICDAKR
ncbi:hypothetical protein FIBSPDRAFT_887098 [Athelia psychrophila]|uniref:RanBP2-type domain-containing protein n=1 Tax=Athelia psychrophila TaxID=1759441 RepID=A0A166PYR3_9AGAM|nr:hypothetical protein FIBSPDRAFT_887098 [Fibularhizoctonia sp. CBS 109695]